jgi:hypothetical protein
MILKDKLKTREKFNAPRLPAPLTELSSALAGVV